MPSGKKKRQIPSSQQSVSAIPTHPPTDKPSATAFEQTHVHSVYSGIASHFSATRHTAWPLVSTFLSSQTKDSIILDIGCGNGKYLGNECKHQYSIGFDTCSELVRLARDKHVERGGLVDVGVADVMNIPLRDGTADAVICIAVIHHLCTRERRIDALSECMKVLRKGGHALFYVWAQERSDEGSEEGSEVVRSSSKMMNRRFEEQDMLVPWHLREKKQGAKSDKVLDDWHQVHKRFYHVYRKGELDEELSEIASIQITKTYFDHQNWCAIVQKL